MLTYRYRGHSMSDPAKYRKREEVDKVREETDPIKLLEARLIERGILDEAEAKSSVTLLKKTLKWRLICARRGAAAGKRADGRYSRR